VVSHPETDEPLCSLERNDFHTTTWEDAVERLGDEVSEHTDVRTPYAIENLRHYRLEQTDSGQVRDRALRKEAPRVGLEILHNGPVFTRCLERWMKVLNDPLVLQARKELRYLKPSDIAPGVESLRAGLELLGSLNTTLALLLERCPALRDLKTRFPVDPPLGERVEDLRQLHESLAEDTRRIAALL
jgi:hypothetical protein